ncbi:DUF4382 domain-containing protein [Waterburya agarophytonicola K14]|uniref:DUF4382 domain-containing protein n=1 Tax=Waterburya agarophytonicola KI4 TaxID=2874699 RepID=A0A964FH93_9CYAN|nr:DUF4382 domain-containing protein [Waterburya agarophytonicola]MCC0177268.1 DUF4382 domain-containing protein [Waterburya agarophytonicola KI4]
MNRISLLLCGITLGSVILTSSSHKNSNKIMAATTEENTLALVANGEDFVRQGFTSKDGWEINFDRVYVNFSNAVAYSTKSSFEPQKGDTKKSIDYQNKVDFLTEAQTTDLAAGNGEAKPILVSEVEVNTGFYNALSWKLDTAGGDSAIAGKTIALIGKAVKDGQTINFDLGFNNPTEYICGEFVGDERQGIVTADSPGQVEATLHFDHIFGDLDTPPEEALNQDALGFEPIAKLASNGTVNLDDTDLASQLSPKDYQKLTKAIAGLGHVGEGHCVINQQ